MSKHGYRKREPAELDLSPQPVAVRAATPLPIEAPRSVTLILGVAMILLLTGIGLLVAYFE